MEPVVIAILFSIAVYLLVLALIPRRMMARPTEYTRNALKTLESEAISVLPDPPSEDTSILLGQERKNTVVTRMFFALPGARKLYPLMLRAGMADQIERFFIIQLAVFAVLMHVLKGLGIAGLLLALAVTYAIAYWRVKRRIAARNAAFLASFPDALDMIVRSVRSGYPLNAAIKMVAENMQPPVSKEFKQVADEAAYGSTLIESLTRLSHRIDEPDVRFFVVMLTVQQDVGGNLSESLSNLSNIIRKRRHLRLKIKAMTSEGRATAYVLGSLPIIMFGLIYLIQPNHLNPLFYTGTGNIMLGFAIAILALGATIVWRLVNPEV